LNSIRELENTVKKESVILKERTQHILTITKELEKNLDESKESIISLSMNYMDIVNSRSDTAFSNLYSRSKEIYSSLMHYSGDMEEINDALKKLNNYINGWNKQKHELSFSLSILMKKYEATCSKDKGLPQSDNEKNIRSSITEILVHDSTPDEKERNLRTSFDKLCSFGDALQEQIDNTLDIKEAVNNLDEEIDIDFEQFDKEMEIHTSYHSLKSENMVHIIEDFEQDFSMIADNLISQSEAKLSHHNAKLSVAKEKIRHLCQHSKNTSTTVRDILSLVGKQYSNNLMDNFKSIIESIYALQLENKQANQRGKEADFLRQELEKSRRLIANLELKNVELSGKLDVRINTGVTESTELKKQIASLTMQVQNISSPKEQHPTDSFLQSRIEKLEETKDKLQQELNEKNNELRELERKISNLELKFNHERWEKANSVEEKTRIQSMFDNVSEQLSQVERDNLKQLDELLSLKTILSNLKGGMEGLLLELSGEFKKWQIESPPSRPVSYIEDIFQLLKQETKILLDFLDQTAGEKEVLTGELYHQLSLNFSMQKDLGESKVKENKELSDLVLSLKAQVSIKDSELGGLQTKFDSIHTVCETYEENYRQMERKFYEERDQTSKCKLIIEDLKQKLQMCSMEYMDLRNLYETASCDLNESKENNESLLGELDVYREKLAEKTEVSLILAQHTELQRTQIKTIKAMLSNLQTILSDLNRLTRLPSVESSGAIALKDIRSLEDLFSDVPIPLSQTEPNESTQSLCDDMNHLKKHLDQLQKPLNIIVNDISDMHQQFNKAKDSLQTDLSKKQAYIHELEGDIGYMRKTLQEMLNNLDHPTLIKHFGD